MDICFSTFLFTSQKMPKQKDKDFFLSIYLLEVQTLFKERQRFSPFSRAFFAKGEGPGMREM